MQPFIFNGPMNGQDQRKQAIIAQMIMGQGAPAAQNPAQGAVQGLNSVMGGFALRNYNRGPFPAAPASPDGSKPNFGQGLMNFFGFNQGGLY